MALSKGNKLTWTDINNLYNSVNTQRNRFGLSSVSATSSSGNSAGSKVTNGVISGLKQAIEDMRATDAGSNANTGVTVPARGTLVYPATLNTMQNVVNNLASVCAGHRANFCSSHREGFRSGFNSSFNSGHRDGFTSCGCDGFYSRSNYRSGFGGNTDYF